MSYVHWWRGVGAAAASGAVLQEPGGAPPRLLYALDPPLYTRPPVPPPPPRCNAAAGQRGTTAVPHGVHTGGAGGGGGVGMRPWCVVVCRWRPTGVAPYPTPWSMEGYNCTRCWGGGRSGTGSSLNWSAVPLGGHFWGAGGLCDCMTETLQVCQGTCMTPSLTAMGFLCTAMGPAPPLIYAKPSRMTSTWQLKYSVTLQSPHKNAHQQISAIIVSAVLNVQPSLHTWLSRLLSITAWAQVVCLSSYPRSTVLRALHAVPRIISRTVWDVDSTPQRCQHVVHVLPCTRDIIFCTLRRGGANASNMVYWY